MIISFLSFLSFLILFFLISILKISNYSKFESSIFSLIFFVSVSAIWVTKGLTIFSIVFIGLLFLMIKNSDKLQFYFPERNEWVPPIAIFFFFYFVYFMFSNFVLSYPHEDYLIYERIGYYNYLYGIENTRTFYNVISKFQPKVELYHFFEIWASVSLSKINGLKYLDNFILVLCPIMIWLSFIGMKQLLPDQSKKLALMGVILILIFINPYDLLVEKFDLPFPISGLGGLMLHLKYVFVLPILIFVLLQLRKNETDYFSLSLISFLYILVFPILLASLFIFDFMQKRFDKKSWIIPFLLGTSFIGLTYYLNQDPFFPKFDLIHFSNFYLVLKVVLIGIIIPVLILFVFLRFTRASDFQKSVLYLVFLTSLVCSFLWIVYFNNIDANQLYRNTMASFFPLALFLLLLNNFKILFFNIFVFVLSLFFLFVYIFPSLKVVTLDSNEAAFLKKVKNINNVLFIPDESEIRSVYRFNERFYFKFNKIFYYHPEINVLNFSTYCSELNFSDTNVEINMINYYRSISPLQKVCTPLFQINSCIPVFKNLWNVDMVIDERVNAY